MSTLFRLTLLVVLSCLLSLVASCGGDDDDDHGADDGGQNAFQTCTETANVLADVDEVSALLGISASDLLDTVGGGFATTAVYTSDTSILTQSPLGGETELTVTIAYDGGEIREIESAPTQGQSEFAAECLNRLEVEVSINFDTADGAFAETWSAVLAQSVAADHQGLADPFLTAQFDPAGLTGTFQIVSVEGPTPDSVTGELYTTAVDPLQGSVDILVEQTSGSGDDGVVSQARHVALSWGAAE